MKNIILSTCALATILFFANTSWNSGTSSKTGDEKINWMTWEEVQKAQKTNPKKVFVDVYTDWCGWCKRMDQTTFQNPHIVSYVNKNYHSVKFNAETKEVINFKGKEYSFVANGRRGYNELAAELMNGRMSYPTTLYLDENLNLLTAVPGYQQPESLDRILNYFGEGKYTQQDWESFSKDYQSPIN